MSTGRAQHSGTQVASLLKPDEALAMQKCHASKYNSSNRGRSKHGPYGHRIHGAAIYGNIDHEYTPLMLACSLPAPWILRVWVKINNSGDWGTGPFLNRLMLCRSLKCIQMGQGKISIYDMLTGAKRREWMGCWGNGIIIESYCGSFAYSLRSTSKYVNALHMKHQRIDACSPEPGEVNPPSFFGAPSVLTHIGPQETKHSYPFVRSDDDFCDFC